MDRIENKGADEIEGKILLLGRERAGKREGSFRPAPKRDWKLRVSRRWWITSTTGATARNCYELLQDKNFRLIVVPQRLIFTIVEKNTFAEELAEATAIRA